MIKASHTPGPWRIDDEDADEINIIGHPEWRCSRNGVYGEWDVATVADLGFDFEGGGPEALANARLIAAAPDMLAALKLISGMDIYHEALAIVDAAIAKAEGRAT